jgi:hypothetical protein
MEIRAGDTAPLYALQLFLKHGTLRDPVARVRR